MAVREGLWDCTACGNIGILGRYTTCTGCGRSRPEGVKFYLPEDAPEITDEKLLKLANDEADWVCVYCDSSNRTQYTSCQHCGSPREEENPVQEVTIYDMEMIPRQGDNAEPEPEPVAVEEKAQSGFRWRYAGLSCLGIIVAAVALICGFTIFAGFYSQEVEVTVSEVSWSREVPIEAYRTVAEEDWTIPEGGRMTDREERIHHYNEILDHYDTKSRQVCEEVKTGTTTYTCGSKKKGNGFFEDKKCTKPVYETRCHTETYKDPVYRKEPVYQIWYDYEIEKWVLDRTEKAAGNGHEAYWPEYTLAENERAGEGVEYYEVAFIDADGKVYTKTLEYEQWLTYDEQEQYTAQVDLFGEVTEIGGGEAVVKEN